MAVSGKIVRKGYRGVDRRVLSGVAAFQGSWLVVAALLGGLAMLMVALGLVAVSPEFTASLWRVSLAIWCSVTLASGLALIGAWRAGGRARPAHLGPALVVAALLISLVPMALPATEAPEQNLVERSLALVAILSVSGVRIVRGIQAVEVEAHLSPLRHLPALFALASALAAVAISVVDRGLVPPALMNGLPVLVCILVAAGVLVVGRGRPQAAVRAVAAAMLLLGTGLCARVEPDSIVIAVVASAALSASAGLMATVAAQSLRFSLIGHEIRSKRTMSALADYQTAASRERERRHDALSALAAIRSASEVLTSTSSDLGADLREDLATAVRAELSRVERMLSPEKSDSAVEADLRLALDPVVLAWRQRGMQIQGLAQQVLVRADPDVVARILNNLLDNAHRHAPGARVRLVADHTDDAVHLSIVDSGPGVPRQRRPEVFLPGASWHESGDGHGLGLASARRLAGEQGGQLQLLDFDEGCWFVLTLPRATSPRLAREQEIDQ